MEIFLQTTWSDAVDFPVPGHSDTFGVIKSAQARGDLAVPAERGWRPLRVHTGKNVLKDLKKLGIALRQALE